MSKKHKPFYCRSNITYPCPTQCRYCYDESKPKPRIPRKKKKRAYKVTSTPLKIYGQVTNLLEGYIPMLRARGNTQTWPVGILWPKGAVTNEDGQRPDLKPQYRIDLRNFGYDQ